MVDLLLSGDFFISWHNITILGHFNAEVQQKDHSPYEL